ncbi:MAG: PD-(D/E)XK nuclease family protein [bacterium]|nr:PD-(D/E)XK nuclease family protein [bacterium]
MIWSFSAHNQFRRCQRAWFYKNIVANALSKKDPLRREAYILSNLKSISAWRGDIVDKTISNLVIPSIRRNHLVETTEAINYAKDLARKQYNYAKKKKYREPGFTKSKTQDEFAAFFNIEYGIQISTQETKIAWEEVIQALNNFLSNKELIKYLQSADKLITQRALLFDFYDFKVRGVPDLIIFFDNKPPHIFDWKVHHFGIKSYGEQLLIYCMALMKCKPHIDFPDLSGIEMDQINLSEYQLLSNQIRNYTASNESILNIEELIAESTQRMSLAGAQLKYDQLEVDEFEVTSYADNCKTCSFKKLCWEINNE